MPAITSLTAESIFFAVNAAIKLSHNVRKAYAQSLRSKALILPLPGIDPNIKIHTIIRFFDDHPDFVGTVRRLEVLHEEASGTLTLKKEEDLKEYKEYYLAFNGVEEGDGFKLEVNSEDLVHLLRIRQWERGREEHQTVLQLVAGTIVELGIDYFLQVPGALNQKSAHGQILYQFLEGLDEIDFSKNKDIKKELSQHLLPSLFTAAAESVAALSPKIANDEKVQAFIKVTAKGIANDVFERSKDMKAHQRQDAVHWGQVMMRSMINHAGHFVFSAPEELFDTNRPVSEIIEKSGIILLNTILDDQSDKVAFRKALSPETLDNMARATLQVVAEHPNVLSGEHGIQKIVSEVAIAVQQEDFLRRGFLPELTRIVLEKSAGHLDLLWKKSTDGPEHLLVIAIQQALEILSQKPLDAPWRPAFTKGNLLEVLEEVLDEVVANPAWITDEVRGRPILSEVFDATFSALDSIPKGERLTAEVIQWLLRHNLEVALTSRTVLDTVKWGGDQLEISILQKALELSLSVVFPKTGGPNVNRLNLLADLMDYVMEAILKQHPNENGLILADLILFNSGIDYSQGFNPQLADQITD
ncbi:MAG: hypothetical protein KDD02_22925, partial [Phaeodactylibacter sp.]|nr:hypothetical protein [Phaeodactylibacter sp.]